jgi:hypothetical protein
MGYDPSSDDGGEAWRTTYWVFGQNLVDMNAKAEAEQRWDLLGVGQILKAWGWLAVTDQSGEIILKEAFDQTKFAFSFDSRRPRTPRSSGSSARRSRTSSAPTAPSTRRTSPAATGSTTATAPSG